jgi:hypothetical protein
MGVYDCSLQVNQTIDIYGLIIRYQKFVSFPGVQAGSRKHSNVARTLRASDTRQMGYERGIHEHPSTVELSINGVDKFDALYGELRERRLSGCATRTGRPVNQRETQESPDHLSDLGFQTVRSKGFEPSTF